MFLAISLTERMAASVALWACLLYPATYDAVKPAGQKVCREAASGGLTLVFLMRLGTAAGRAFNGHCRFRASCDSSSPFRSNGSEEADPRSAPAAAVR